MSQEKAKYGNCPRGQMQRAALADFFNTFLLGFLAREHPAWHKGGT